MGMDTVASYLTRYGWVFERHDEVLVAGLETDGDPLLVAFQYSPPWLRISMPAYAAGESRSESYLRKLLRLNHETRLVRFTLDESGQVTLCCDIYCNPELEYQQFEISLDALTYVGIEALSRATSEAGDEDLSI